MAASKLDAVEGAIAGILLAIGLVIVFGAFFGRELFGVAFSWTDEVARYLLVWITYIGAAAVTRDVGHIRVDFLVEILPSAVRKFLNLFTLVLSLVFTLSVFVYSVEYVHGSWQLGLMTAESTLSMPKWIILAVIPVGFLLMSVRLVIQFWRMVSVRVSKQ